MKRTNRSSLYEVDPFLNGSRVDPGCGQDRRISRTELLDLKQKREAVLHAGIYPHDEHGG
jgi:hypothetical protein